MRLSTEEAERQKYTHLQRLNDRICFWAAGLAAWMIVWTLIGKAAVSAAHNHPSIVHYSDFTVLSSVVILGLILGVAVLKQPVQKLLWERDKLRTELYPTRQ